MIRQVLGLLLPFTAGSLLSNRDKMRTLREKHVELTGIIGEQEVKRLLHSWYDRVIKREKTRKCAESHADIKEDVSEFINAVLADLHKKTGIEYRKGKETKFSIIARKNEGYKIEDFRKVHEIKCRHWLEDPKMSRYLHPMTLYRPTKFERYLQEYNIWVSECQKKKKAAEIRNFVNQEEKPDQESAERIKAIISGALKKMKMTGGNTEGK